MTRKIRLIVCATIGGLVLLVVLAIGLIRLWGTPANGLDLGHSVNLVMPKNVKYRGLVQQYDGTKTFSVLLDDDQPKDFTLVNTGWKERSVMITQRYDLEKLKPDDPKADFAKLEGFWLAPSESKLITAKYDRLDFTVSAK